MTEPRIIKRYTNRKLYDTRDSRYVTLSQIAGMVQAGEDMTVIDNSTKEDLTSLTLAQIIYEQEKRSAEVLPLSALRELVRRSEARLADLREGRVGRLLTRGEGGEGEEPARDKDDPDGLKSLFESSRGTFEDWQRRIDEQLHTMLDTLAPFRQLQEEIQSVAQRIEEAERRLRRLTRKRKETEETDPTTTDVEEKEEGAE